MRGIAVLGAMSLAACSPTAPSESAPKSPAAVSTPLPSGPAGAAAYPVRTSEALAAFRAALPNLRWEKAYLGEGAAAACVHAIGPALALQLCDTGGQVSHISLMSRHQASQETLDEAIGAMFLVLGAKGGEVEPLVQRARSALADGNQAKICAGACLVISPIGRNWTLMADPANE